MNLYDIQYYDELISYLDCNFIYPLNNKDKLDLKKIPNSDISYYLYNYGLKNNTISMLNKLELSLDYFFNMDNPYFKEINIYNVLLSQIYKLIDYLDDGYFFYNLIGGCNSFNKFDIISYIISSNDKYDFLRYLELEEPLIDDIDYNMDSYMIFEYLEPLLDKIFEFKEYSTELMDIFYNTDILKDDTDIICNLEDYYFIDYNSDVLYQL